MLTAAAMVVWRMQTFHPDLIIVGGKAIRDGRGDKWMHLARPACLQRALCARPPPLERALGVSRPCRTSPKTWTPPAAEPIRSDPSSVHPTAAEQLMHTLPYADEL